jgi:fucose permease
MLPTLSARWSLNYSQGGALINTQYIAATVAVALSGMLVTRCGYRFAMKTGLLLAGLGVALLLAGSKLLGMVCIAAYGTGLGLSVPAANLLVAEVNPDRRSSALNLLNFSWSAGAVACPFLVALAARRNHFLLFLASVAGCMFLVLAGIAAMPSSIREPTVTPAGGDKSVGTPGRNQAFWALAILFLLYVGTENAFGMWLASYAKSLGSLTVTMSLMTPSFFYASITLGRWLAPLLLRSIDEAHLAQAGLLVACAGMGGLMASRFLPSVLLSACVAGLGISTVYPITIALLSREFGASASRVGSIMFTLSNVGGGLLPWIAGICSNRFGTLKAGVAVPLSGALLMFLFYLRNWKAGFSQPRT